MDQPERPKYDLEERTFLFAQRVRAFVKKLPRTVCNIEDVKQLVRSSGSVGSNYIEANESLGKKDFLMRIRVSRKESKESRYHLRLVDTRLRSVGGDGAAGLDTGKHRIDEHLRIHPAEKRVRVPDLFGDSDFGF